MKSRDGKSQRREEKRKPQKKEDPGARTSWPDERWKIAHRCGTKHVSKSKCTKHPSSGTLLEVAPSKKCTLFWREAHLQVKMYKTPQFWSTFRSCAVEKVHAAVARRCAKHMSKSKCTKHSRFGPLLEVEMSKECTPLWREAHFEVKSAKNCGVRSTFGRSDVVSRGRRKGLCTML